VSRGARSVIAVVIQKSAVLIAENIGSKILIVLDHQVALTCGLKIEPTFVLQRFFKVIWPLSIVTGKEFEISSSAR